MDVFIASSEFFSICRERVLREIDGEAKSFSRNMIFFFAVVNKCLSFKEPELDL